MLGDPGAQDRWIRPPLWTVRPPTDVCGAMAGDARPPPLELIIVKRSADTHRNADAAATMTMINWGRVSGRPQYSSGVQPGQLVGRQLQVCGGG